MSVAGYRENNWPPPAGVLDGVRFTALGSGYKWIRFRFDCDSTAVRLPFNCNRPATTIRRLTLWS